MAERIHDIISIEKPRHVQVEISKGSIGSNGPVFVPYIDDDRILSWSNNGGYPNPPSVDLGKVMVSITNAEIRDMLDG